MFFNLGNPSFTQSWVDPNDFLILTSYSRTRLHIYQAISSERQLPLANFTSEEKDRAIVLLGKEFFFKRTYKKSSMDFPSLMGSI